MAMPTTTKYAANRNFDAAMKWVAVNYAETAGDGHGYRPRTSLLLLRGENGHCYGWRDVRRVQIANDRHRRPALVCAPSSSRQSVPEPASLLLVGAELETLARYAAGSEASTPLVFPAVIAAVRLSPWICGSPQSSAPADLCRLT